MTAINFFEKQIHDAVHGPTYISRVERDVIDTRAFQRLRHIKQLGLGTLVFPSANYTRFSHSIGACHIAGQIIDAVRRNTKHHEISDYDKQIYRLAALLHDIGHYPFSHLFEHTLDDLKKERSSQALVENPQPGSHDSDIEEVPFDFIDHEEVGQTILQHDEEIKNALTENGVKLVDITSLFSKDESKYLKAVVSSDLDCDRLDYLMRSAHNSGLPYGKVDIPYIVNNFTLDEHRKLCLRKRASSAGDHLLVSRLFDYAQLSYNKTSSGFEVALKVLIRWMISTGLVKCERDDILKGIANHDWHGFDDKNFISRLDNTVIPEELSHFYRSVSRRKPPILLGEMKTFVDANDRDAQNALSLQRTLLNQTCQSLTDECHLQRSQIQTWNAPIKIAKKGWFITRGDTIDENETQELVHILGGESSNPNLAVPLIQMRHTLSHQLSSRVLEITRAYYFPKNKAEAALVSDKLRTGLRRNSDHLTFV